MPTNVFVVQSAESHEAVKLTLDFVGIRIGTDCDLFAATIEVVPLIKKGERQLIFVPNRIGDNGLVSANVIKSINDSAIVFALTSANTSGWKLSRLDGLIHKTADEWRSAFVTAAKLIKAFHGGADRNGLVSLWKANQPKTS